jgi:hypothetical protein
VALPSRTLADERRGDERRIEHLVDLLPAMSRAAIDVANVVGASSTTADPTRRRTTSATAQAWSGEAPAPIARILSVPAARSAASLLQQCGARLVEEEKCRTAVCGLRGGGIHARARESCHRLRFHSRTFFIAIQQPCFHHSASMSLSMSIRE